ncbi:PREDICTED: zinc finger protein 622 [Vollenhovia emeryi]|uniref:zinc finger protein 622 n=1 Tax=Vollenhovia emeryi TaxID=411798 RepID=UPI0005F5698F|nr:PREDICTED: zinc finger protein 622 [Vollenhovia emeryi]XP_011862423.1 PREDICTED: zinc finger protein 622 [Vollenhovia emeryi]
MSNSQESFTCWTCKVKFTDLAIFRSHYRSEWHRYNLHLTTNGLHSMSLEDFLTKSANSLDDKNKQSCEVCQKEFKDQKQYEHHMSSKTHKKRQEKKLAFSNIQRDTDEKESDTDSEPPPLESFSYNKFKCYDCLFCYYRVTMDLESIMKHMVEMHSFFVPDLEYCVDLGGLLEYLAEKICTEFQCIWCNESGRRMQSREAVKMHMIEKGHCKMLFEGETMLEYSSFYDYSSSYPDAEDADPDEDLPESPETLDDEVYVMKLPSGKSIVHRSLALYYKQNVPVETTLTIKNHNYWLRKQALKQISLGNETRQLEIAQKTTRDVRKLQQIQAKYSTQLQVKQNKLQKHFRPQTNF